MRAAAVSLILFAVSAAVLSAGIVPHIGFVYPAGGTPGSTVTVTIGGQYLKDFEAINLSGTPVSARMTDYLRIYDKQEAGRMKRMKETLQAKMDETSDKAVKAQMQRQIDLVDQEMSMMGAMRRADKLDPVMAAKKQFNPQIAERITLEFNLPSNLKPGDLELRVVTTNGISNPLVFQIGQLPETAEVEPNDPVAKAMPLPALPVLVNGQIMPGDVDSFRFHAMQGQTLVFRAEARALIPYLADTVPGWFQAVLTLYDEQGNEIAFDDDYRFDPDPVLIYNVPKNGDYILSIRDSIFRGREDFVYRISMGELPFVENIFPFGGAKNTEVDLHLSGVNLPYTTQKLKTGYDAPEIREIRVEKDGLVSNARKFDISSLPDAFETEPNNTFAQPQSIVRDVIMNGTIGEPGDQDWFSFEGRAGDQKTIEVFARRLGSPLDSRLTLLDAQQEVLAVNDDAQDKSMGLLTHAADSRIDFTLPRTGTYFARLDDVEGKGGDEYVYRLMIGREQPDYQLRIVPSSLNVPRNGTAVATVHAIRTGGFTGEIQLEAVNFPAGVDLERAVIPEGSDTARIILSAHAWAEEPLMTLEIEGSADCGMRTVRRRAVPAEDMMQAFIYRHWVPAQTMLVRVSDPEPVTVSLDIPRDGVFRAGPGREIIIRATTKWNEKKQRNIKLALAEPPEWLTLKTASLSGQGGTIVLTVSPNAEPGDTATVLLNGTIRIQKSEKDPDYNPVMKFMNSKTVDFTIDAISVQVTN